MAVINRALDASEQRKILEAVYGAIATGATSIVEQVPYNSVLQKAQFAAFGISGSPTAQLALQRFIPGAGFTTILVGSANALPAFGTSGVLVVGASLPAAGSTLLNLIANDVITVTLGGTTSAVTGLCVNLVIQPLQDVKTNFGLV